MAGGDARLSIIMSMPFDTQELSETRQATAPAVAWKIQP